ncbi:MAG: TetR/AcrR family transcriptional regulator [Steroidobacteraceae bacterium]|nr:TetR/AcrR family transcriptional regulator [Steroidobacteraceae bacterium]
MSATRGAARTAPRRAAAARAARPAPARAAGAKPGGRSPQLKAEVQEFKRRRILEQTRDLLYEHGYEATTLDAIAAGLQVTKPFIYSYYRNKSEILRAICEIGIRGSLRALDDALATRLPSREKLRMIVEGVSRVVIENQKYIVVYEREQKNLEPADAKLLIGLRREWGVRLAGLLESGTRSGDFRVDDPLQTAVSIGGLLTWIAHWYRSPGRWGQAEVVLHAVAMVERMVGVVPADRGAQR